MADAKVNITPVNNNSQNDAEFKAAYRDERTVVISSVHNYSGYRKANMKALGQRTETIGSCVRTCQVLGSNAEEMAAYMPSIIGISPNHPDFTARVKSWLSNIQIKVDNSSISLDITFNYKHKSDYLAIKKREDEINAEFDKVDRSNMAALEKALTRKINELNALESTKYLYGMPEKITDYIIYRHCLLYKEIAKDPALINGSPDIRFYIKDETKEAEMQKKIIKEKQKAMHNFAELGADDEKLNAVYIAIVSQRNENLAFALDKTATEKLEVIMNFVNTNPDKFNKFYSDKHIQRKAFIELLIVRGELIRSEFNQQISTAEGDFIGANMNEAITWFDNPNNKAAVTILENKLKLS